MQLSIIIVNYKSVQLLLNCLASVYGETVNTRFEVIVVDNASGDDSKAIIIQQFPQVKWIEMSYNAGFARANNEGIRQSQSPVVLLLNADTIVENGAIDNCYADFMRSDAVACGVQLLNADRSPQISGNYFMRGGLNYLLPLPYVGNLLKAVGNTVGVAKPNVPNAIGTVEVDWINGAFLMVKKDAIERVGLMDEDFFLYSEEAEWCSRLRKVGKLLIFGEYNVIHLQGETATEVFNSTDKGYFNLFDKKGLQIIVSNFLRIRKQYGVGWLLIISLFYFLEVLVFPLGLLIEKIFKGGKSSYKWWQVNGFIRNFFKTAALLPRMVSNRPHFYKVL